MIAVIQFVDDCHDMTGRRASDGRGRGSICGLIWAADINQHVGILGGNAPKQVSAVEWRLDVPANLGMVGLDVHQECNKPERVQGEHALVFVIGFNPTLLLLSAGCLPPSGGEFNPANLPRGLNLTS